MSKQIELFDTFQIKLDPQKKNHGLIISDAKNDVRPGYNLVCEVNATHSGTLINNRIYPPESMKKGVRTWTSPYKKPVLVNHDDTKDPIGRVISARYEKTQLALTGDYKPVLRESSGYGFQRLTIKVTDQEAIQKILDGRYETVSVRMSTDHCFCSICNADWSGDGPCEHTPGSKYEDKLAYLTTGDLNYRELSFVNIPADEYAGVKEAIISENKDASEIKLYANSDTAKVLADLGSGNNLYTLLDSDVEDSDSIITHLLDRSNKTKKIDKEEDVKLTDLTKEQLMDLELVKELIQDAAKKAKDECNCDAAKAECEEKIKKMKDEMDAAAAAKEKVEDPEDAKKKKDPEKEEEKEEPEEDAKKKEGEKGHEKEESPEEEKKEEEEDPEEEEEEEEEGKEKKAKDKITPGKKKGIAPENTPENKGKGKEGGVKHGAGNQAPTGEDPGDSAHVQELEISNKKLLDENVRINAEIHKLVAEKLYDLKKTLRKPDVVSISTPDARDKKIEEYAQRSVSSLKDQIKDLQIEQETALANGLGGQDVDNPAISQSDVTNEVLEDKKKIKEGKQETLTRLFPKSK